MEELEIYYNNKKLVNNEFLKPSETQVKPKIEFNYNLNKLYTLIMYDPDAVSGTHIHWLVANINKNISEDLESIVNAEVRNILYSEPLFLVN